MLKGSKKDIIPKLTYNESSTRIRERILLNRDLRVEGNRLTRELPSDSTGKKSPLMLYVEDKFRQDIEDIIWHNSVKQAAKMTHVSSRTISRWRELFPCDDFDIITYPIIINITTVMMTQAKSVELQLSIAA